MRRARYMLVAAFLLAAVVVLVANFFVPQPPAIALTLQDVSLTNDLQPEQPVAVFVVTNAGRKAAFLSFDKIDYQDQDGRPHSMSLPVIGIFGQCSIPAKTNCTVSVRGPHSDGPWRVHATVFLRCSVFQKALHASARLRACLLGMAAYQTLWVKDLTSEAYKVCSPEVPPVVGPFVAWESPPNWAGTNAPNPQPLGLAPSLAPAAFEISQPPAQLNAPASGGQATNLEGWKAPVGLHR